MSKHLLLPARIPISAGTSWPTLGGPGSWERRGPVGAHRGRGEAGCPQGQSGRAAGSTCGTAGGTRTGGREPRPSSASSSQRCEPPAHSPDPDCASTSWGERGTGVWVSLVNKEVQVGAAPSFLNQKGKGWLIRISFLLLAGGQEVRFPRSKGLVLKLQSERPVSSCTLCLFRLACCGGWLMEIVGGILPPPLSFRAVGFRLTFPALACFARLITIFSPFPSRAGHSL